MANNNREDLFVSVVLIANNEPAKTLTALKELGSLLSKKYTNYEIICVTHDTLFVVNKNLSRLLEVTPCVRIVHLAKKDSVDVMIFAGLETAIGDSVIVLLAGKDPVSMLPKFVEQNKKHDIVFGISQTRIRQGAVNEYGSQLFYWYNKKFLGITIPNRSTYYVAFNRGAVNALTRTGRYARHIRHLARQVGYSETEIAYTPFAQYSDKRSLRALAVSALELATNYSKHPLRFVSWVGFMAASLNAVYAIYVILVRIFKKQVAEGWTTTSLQLSVMFFFLFAILAILTEYIGKILEESRGEQPYHIINELNSKVSVADVTRRNITSKS